MRIISLYIDSFGKLNNFSLDFKTGLNKILKENGFGKTTLAVFIKSMFYGIKGGNKGGLNDDNERVKYYTWNSTKLIGGTLDFELDGESFRIERYFGDKPSLDTFKIINLKTNKLDSKYTENLGEEIFGVDVNGFERSTYLPQKLVDFKKDNSSITNMLTNLTYGSSDNSDVDNVILKLENASKKYYKLSGKSGLIADNKNKISNLETKINECEAFENNANYVQEKIDEIDVSINKIINELNNVKPKLEKAFTSFALNDEYNKTLIEIEKTNAKYLELKNFFKDENISENILNELISLSKELIKINSRIETLNQNLNESELKEYTNKFNNNVPDLKQIDTYIEVCDKKQYNNSKNISGSSNINFNKNMLILLISISLMLGVLTIISYVFINLILGIVLTVVLIAVIVYTILKVTILSKQQNNQVVDNNIEVSKNLDELNDIKEYLSTYNFDTSNLKQSLLNLRGEVMVYLNLLKSEEQTFNLLGDLEEKQKQLENEIVPFLKKFYSQINDEYFTLLSDIKNDYILYKTLQNKLNEYETKLQEYKNKVDINLDVSKLKEQEEKLNDSLKLLLTEKEKLINEKNNMLNNANLKQDYIQSLSFEKEELNKNLKEFNLISATISMLKQAKENLCSKYLEPIKNNFIKNLEFIKDSEIKDINIDIDLNVNVVDNTKTINVEYFSKGYKDIVNLCLRLALIDTLFTKNKPFIILDDPFINLDNKKFESVMDIINLISNKYQIIYLTCNTSRV